MANIQPWTVGGRPGDAAIVGLDHLSESTDILISGINQGANIGFDLSISGTVGAALQGYFRGITSLAISYAMTPQTEVDWETAEHIASIICGKVLSEEIPKKSFLEDVFEKVDDFGSEKIQKMIFVVMDIDGQITMK